MCGLLQIVLHSTKLNLRELVRINRIFNFLSFFVHFFLVHFGMWPYSRHLIADGAGIWSISPVPKCIAVCSSLVFARYFYIFIYNN